jgi:hypothetical protein
MMQNTYAFGQLMMPITFWHFSKNAIKMLLKRRKMLEKSAPMKFDSLREFAFRKI